MTSYEEIKVSIQWISFLFSVFFNCLLIFLIINKSPKKMGNYRYLMIYFSCFAIFFSSVDVVLGPYVHAHGTGFCVLAKGLESKHLELGLIWVLCGCFGVTITFFAIHFVFRYFALERKGRLSYFHGWRFAVWLAIPVVNGIIWGSTVGVFMAPSEEKTEYWRQNILDVYGLPMENVSYIATMYWRTLPNGKKEIVQSTLIAMIILFSMMIISFSIVCYYGYLSYERITTLMQEGESLYTKNLQRQLYKALVIQAIIPVVIMYIPVGSYLSLPMFGVDLESFSKLVTFLYAAYPALDPLPLFFVIDNYRLALADYLYCFTSKNRITMGEDEISRGKTTN